MREGEDAALYFTHHVCGRVTCGTLLIFAAADKQKDIAQSPTHGQ